MLLIATTLGLSTATAHPRRIPEKCAARPAPVLCSVHFHRHAANKLRARMGQRAIGYRWVAERYPRRRPRILAYWLKVHRRTLRHWHRYQAANTVPEPYRSNLMCIHHYEGSMVAYNPAGPYYGGWQMDSAFEARWGPDMLTKYGGRDARYWSPHDQLVVAYRAARRIGYGSWPNTARMCGLL